MYWLALIFGPFLAFSVVAPFWDRLTLPVYLLGIAWPALALLALEIAGIT